MKKLMSKYFCQTIKHIIKNLSVVFVLTSLMYLEYVPLQQLHKSPG